MFNVEIDDTFSLEQLLVLKKVIGHKIDKQLYASSGSNNYDEEYNRFSAYFTNLFLLYLTNNSNTIILSFKFWAEDNPFFHRYDTLLLEEISQRQNWHITNDVKEVPFDIKQKTIKKIQIYGTKAIRNITSEYVAKIWKSTQQQQRVYDFYKIPIKYDIFRIVRKDNHFIVLELDTQESLIFYTESSAYMNQFSMIFCNQQVLRTKEETINIFKKLHLEDNDADFLLYYEIDATGIHKKIDDEE